MKNLLKFLKALGVIACAALMLPFTVLIEELEKETAGKGAKKAPSTKQGEDVRWQGHQGNVTFVYYPKITIYYLRRCLL